MSRRHTQGLTILLLATLLLPGCGVFEPPAAASPAPIEYPIEHYRVTDSGMDLALWKQEVGRVREQVRRDYPYDETSAQLRGSSKENEFIEKAVDPARVVWRDPSAFWRDPVLLSWWELIDEMGTVSKVIVVSSNQSKEMDAKIIAWCLEGKRWEPPVVDGKPLPSIRSASINLGESNWHIAHWQKKVPEEAAAVFLIVLIAIAVRGSWTFARRIRQAPKN